MVRSWATVSPLTARLVPIVLTAALGVLDWISGYELQSFVFYFVPVALAAWLLGQRWAYALVVVSTITWLVANLYGHQVLHATYPIWNTAIRFVAFATIAYTVGRLRDLVVHEQAVSEALRQALSEVQTLTGLLPICMTCKKIRDDQGYWRKLEEYLSSRTTVRFSHGYCLECGRKALEDAGLDGSALDAPAEGEGTPTRASGEPDDA